ncbi:tetratricopeptide repeat protein [Methylomonas sp. AM2-LC]|uniref:tetratricopeptide repeat protein n=1 Tax=Methylomonas sp. AM2-LC TaxID=3153301 RepID=UPI003263EBE4
MIKSDEKTSPALHLPDLYLDKLTQLSSVELERLLTGDAKQAAIWVRMAAIKGITAAQIRLGRMCLEGYGVNKNPAEAFSWFQRAAASQDADAINMLARCYENGWGVTLNHTLAFQHYAQAAQLDHDWAQYNLGHCFLDGLGTQRDPLLAFYWYQKAANQGHGRAMNLLARCYEEGWGVERQLKTAYHWYHKSAESGYFRGQYNWASLLVDAGRIHEAAEWFLLAAKQGTQNVRRTIARQLVQSPHPHLQANALTVLEYCCENGAAQDFQHYALALLQGLSGAPEPDKAQYWLNRAAELKQDVIT